LTALHPDGVLSANDHESPVRESCCLNYLLMEPAAPKYRREFLRSPHHAWFGLLTVGAGFMTGEPLYLLAGATAYVLGWIYLPDVGWFRRWVDKRHDAVKRAAALGEVEAFLKKREALLEGLSTSRRNRYRELAAICEDIESATGENPLAEDNPQGDPRLRKLEELMWTYLRLLSIEESLDRFLETERRDNVPELVREGDREVTELSAEVDALKKQGRSATLDARERLLNSRQERLQVLHKRLHRVEQAQSNLALVVSEQERLDQQIKLIRADAIASRNANTLTARIDATVEHLDHTNKWIAELDEFKDLVGDIPATEFRVGFNPLKPPVLQSSNPLRPPGIREKERQ
jgi:hypothetical protein